MPSSSPPPSLQTSVDGVNPTLSNVNNDAEIPKAVYRRRWFMLFVVVFLNVSNGSLWITFAPITNASASFFQVDNSAINWLSVVFFVTTIGSMLVALYIIDRYGFKVGVQTGCIFNTVGCIIRMIGTQEFVPASDRFAVTLVGQAVVSLAQPFAMALPTKVSEVWFPENERTMATSFAAMGNPFGFMLGNLISPLLVSTPNDIPTMNAVFCGVGILASFFGLIVRSSHPPLPPSVTASRVTEKRDFHSYVTELKHMMTNFNFVVLMLAVGGGMALVCAMQTMLGQTLCSWGYVSTFAGLCGALMVVGGLVGSAVFSFITSRYRCFEEIAKIGYGLSTLLTLAIYLVICVFRDVSYLIAILNMALGFVAIGIYPICLELGVETTYPLDEVLSSGIIVVVGQIQGAIFVPAMTALGQPLDAEAVRLQKCTVDQATEALDMTYSGLFLTAMGTVWSILFIGFFRAQYNRLEEDNVRTAVDYSEVQINASP